MGVRLRPYPRPLVAQHPATVLPRLERLAHPA
jgi:hypothetical protein